jgi:hypothetical protein
VLVPLLLLLLLPPPPARGGGGGCSLWVFIGGGAVAGLAQMIRQSLIITQIDTDRETEKTETYRDIERKRHNINMSE